MYQEFISLMLAWSLPLMYFIKLMMYTSEDNQMQQ